MRVSFKLSKKGARYRPKPNHGTLTVLEDDDAIDASPEISKNSSVNAATKPLSDVAADVEEYAEISDAEISFFINLFPDGYSIQNTSENRIAPQGTIKDDPKFLYPYDRTSESFFSAVECGRLPSDFFDDIPCKYINGAVVCEVRDYRNCTSEPGVNGSSVDSSPTTIKIRLKMSFENVVNDIPLIADSSWTYGDFLEAEARILKAIHPKLYLDPTPNSDRLFRSPTSVNLNLNIPELRRKRIMQLRADAGIDNHVAAKKVCTDRNPSNCPLVQQPDDVNTNIGPSNILASGVGTFPADTVFPESSSLSDQSKHQTGFSNPRVTQDHRPGTVFSAPGGSSTQNMLNSYDEIMNSNSSSTHGKRKNQDGQLSPTGSLRKRHMDGFNADSQSKNSLLQKQSVGRWIELPNGVSVLKNPQQSFDGSFDQDGGAMSSTMGQPGMRCNLEQELVESKRPNKYEKPVLSSDVILQLQSMREHRAQMAAWRSRNLPEKAEKSLSDRFSKIEMLTVRYQLNCKKKKVDEYKKTTAFPTQQLNHHLSNDHNNDIPKDEASKMPLSKSLMGGSMNVCKTRVLNFVQNERVLEENESTIVPKSRTRMILSEKQGDGTVAMHYGELDDGVAEEECLPTLPNTHFADLLAAEFCTQMVREGYHVEGDHLQPKPIITDHSSGDQPNNSSAKMQQISEAVLGHPSNEAVKPSDSKTNNASANSSQNRMHRLAKFRDLPQISRGGLLPAVSMPQSTLLQSDRLPSFQQQQQQSQHPLMQQQLQRSSATMIASNPLSHLNATGQNSNVQQFGHVLNNLSPLQLQILQQQQQMQRKMIMGLGNVGMGNNMGGARAGTGVSAPMTGPISSMGQGPINMNQASTISNVIKHRLRTGMITPAEAAIMTSKLRTAQNRNILGGAGNIGGFPSANRQVHPGSSNYSMLRPSMNPANMKSMQQTAMGPPKLMSNMNVYMNQQQQPQQQLSVQELTYLLQGVRSPRQQVGSPSMGSQLSSQTTGSVRSMAKFTNGL